MLINEICKLKSYRAMNDILNGITLHDLQCVDVLKMIANKRALVIYDTGTGKTLLAATAMKLLIREDPSRLFVMFINKDQISQTPKKLQKFAGLSCITSTAAADVRGYFLSENLQNYNVILLTHECLHNSDVLNAIYDVRDKICGIIIDEAHGYNNFNNAHSASVLKAMLKRFEFVWGLTATPIVSDVAQIARLSNMLLPDKYTNPKKLANDMLHDYFKISSDPGFFINRKASELGRVSSPKGFVVSVSPQPHQLNCNCGGVELFQICKGDGATNQVNALIKLIQENNALHQRGLVYISQTSVLRWVTVNLQKAGIKYACINGNTPMDERSVIEDKFAGKEYDVILTSVTTAVDLDCEYVVFYEFTVLVNQMIGRAHRSLEPKDLNVYFIITRDTNEEVYFVNNIYAKCQMVRDILGKENSAVDDVATHLGITDD